MCPGFRTSIRWLPRGQLTFAVFNAWPGPDPTIRRGQPIFLIWYARLDRETAFKKDGQIHKCIDIETATSVAGELQSFAGLSKKLKDQDKSLGDRIHAIEREQTYYRGIGALVLAIAIAFSVNWLKDTISRESRSATSPQRPRHRRLPRDPSGRRSAPDDFEAASVDFAPKIYAMQVILTTDEERQNYSCSGHQIPTLRLRTSPSTTYRVMMTCEKRGVDGASDRGISCEKLIPQCNTSALARVNMILHGRCGFRFWRSKGAVI